MEEKKVCTECENTEQKLEELTQEEADQVAGGYRPGMYIVWICQKCDNPYENYGKTCDKCGAPWH